MFHEVVLTFTKVVLVKGAKNDRQAERAAYRRFGKSSGLQCDGVKSDQLTEYEFKNAIGYSRRLIRL